MPITLGPEQGLKAKPSGGITVDMMQHYTIRRKDN